MLAVEMLFLDTIRRRLHLRIDKLSVACHLRHFLQYDRIVDCLCGILAPGKRSVIRTENRRCVHRLDASCLKGLNNHKSGVLLICLVDLLRRQISGARNRSEEIVCMRCAVKRNVSARLRPRDSLRGMGMYNTTDLLVLFVEFDMGRRVGGRLISALDLISVKIHDYHIVRA